MTCKKHLEARTKANKLPISKIFSELTDLEIHCAYDCEGDNGNCKGYEPSSRTLKFYLRYGVTCAEELYKKTLSLKELQFAYRRKRGLINLEGNFDAEG